MRLLHQPNHKTICAPFVKRTEKKFKRIDEGKIIIKLIENKRKSLGIRGNLQAILKLIAPIFCRALPVRLIFNFYSKFIRQSYKTVCNCTSIYSSINPSFSIRIWVYGVYRWVYLSYLCRYCSVYQSLYQFISFSPSLCSSHIHSPSNKRRKS